MKDALPKILFMFAIATLVFGYGFVSGSMQIFPYQTIKDARTAFSALRELNEAKDTTLENLEFWDETGLNGPLYKRLATAAGNENVFVLGNDLTYPESADGQSYLAWIADRDGNVKHAWMHPGELWDTLENRNGVEGTWRTYTTGAHLYDNGDLLISYQGVNVFPIAMGLAKFDKDSNLLWKNSGLYHHWFSVAPNGDIYVPGMKLADSPMQIDDREKKILCKDGQFAYDTVAILDADGNLKKEIDLLQSLMSSELTGIFNSASAAPISLQSCDPMHLNDIQILTEDMTAEFPALANGDLLLSFRALNGIGILDPVTETFKWFHAGTTQHQHSPRFYRGNRALVFDNYGGQISEGTTRVVSIELGVGRTDVLFPRKSVSRPDRNIQSRVAGHIDVHSSSDRMLVAFSEQGLLWEVDTDSGEVLWEYVNTHSVQGRPGRVMLMVAKYAEGLSFPMNGGQF